MLSEEKEGIEVWMNKLVSRVFDNVNADVLNEKDSENSLGAM